MSAGDLARRLGFLFALALFPVFLVAPAAIFTAFWALVVGVPWWVAALVAVTWLAFRSATAWRLGAPGEPDARLLIPRLPGDPLWDLTIDAARQLGCPEPTAVELIAEPNAEVDAADGGIVVRIGLPLLACCPADDIAAVISHELSHARLGHVDSWQFERRCLAVLDRLATGTKVGFQRLSLMLHLKVAAFVVLPDKRRDEAEADLLAAASTGADVFAAALLRTRAVAQAWERGSQVFFGLPKLAGLHSHRLDGLRDLAAAAARAGAVDFAEDSVWSTHPGTGKRLDLAGAGLTRTALAPAARTDLVLPWPELLAADAELDDTGAARFPTATWERSWQPALTAALREGVRDPAVAWSLPEPTPRILLQRLAAGPDEIAADLAASDTELCHAVTALAAVQQGLVEFHWQDAAGVMDLSAGLAAITAAARGASGSRPLAALLEVPPAESAGPIAAIGIDLDHPLDLARRPEEPAILRALFPACRLDARGTTVALPAGLTDQQGWHALLLNTGVALIPAQKASTMGAILQEVIGTVQEVCGFGWAPDERTIWIPRESVSAVTLVKRGSRVTVASASGAVSFAIDAADFDPAPFLGLWGRGRVSA